MMRANPSAFVPYVQSMKSRFTGNTFLTFENTNMGTNEGVTAVAELETFL